MGKFKVMKPEHFSVLKLNRDLICFLLQISTALLMLVATLWGGAGMGFWHGAQFYEFNRVHNSFPMD